MHAKEGIQASLKASQHLTNTMLSDLSDQDLLVRPVPNANHIAWQLGHLILAEHSMLKAIGGTPPPLPGGFAEQHAKQMANSEKTEGWCSKAEYVDLMEKTRAATMAAAERMADADLDKPVEGPMSRIAPKLGMLAAFPASHALMHLGQFSVVRRKLGKPVMI